MLNATSSVERRGNPKVTAPYILFSLFFSQFFSCASLAQEDEMHRYDIPNAKSYMISAGGGFPDFYSALTWYDNSIKPATDKVLIKDYGAVLIRIDQYRKAQKIDIGAAMYYTRQYFEYNTQNKYAKVDTFDYQDIGIGLRLNRYLVRHAQFHFYFGAGGGVRILLHSRFYTPLYGELVVGMRYFPLQHLGIFLELGPSKVLAQAGLSIKL